MITYFNLKSQYGIETIDELDSHDFTNIKEFRKERQRLVREYHSSKMYIYLSKRCTNEWKNG